MEIFYAAAAMFAFVFLKAFQQRNVAFDHYWPVVPISWLMVATEFYVIVSVVRIGLDFTLIAAVGTAAGTGSILAMLLHKRIFRRVRRPILDMLS